MSIVRTYSVFCDMADVDDPDRPCTMWVAETVHGATSARAEARGAGWRYKRGVGDVCPLHEAMS